MAKTVVLGVTGSIACYKACELTRLFVKGGWDVHVVMTAHAKEFVTPLTFRTLSRNPVESELFNEPSRWMPGHVSLADRADLVVVAPATANVIAKAAHGIADDLLSSTILATRAPLVFAPAMNVGMWENPVTQANIAALRSRGARFAESPAGELACGTSGAGRMAEPPAVYAFATQS